MVFVSEAVKKFVENRIEMEPYQINFPGRYIYTNRKKTLTLGFIDGGVPTRNGYSSHICYNFHERNIFFIIEFDEWTTRYWVEKQIQRRDGDIIISESPLPSSVTIITKMVEVFHVYNPRSLLDICKSYIMNNFSLDQVLELKEIVPEMGLKNFL
jgi:hypothetical protein